MRLSTLLGGKVRTCKADFKAHVQAKCTDPRRRGRIGAEESALEPLSEEDVRMEEDQAGEENALKMKKQPRRLSEQEVAAHEAGATIHIEIGEERALAERAAPTHTRDTVTSRMRFRSQRWTTRSSATSMRRG